MRTGLTIRPKRFGNKLVAFVAVAALVLQPAYGLVASQVASAVGGVTTVSPSNLGGWNISATDGGTATFQTSAGEGALKIGLTNGSSRVRVNKVVDAPLSTVSDISFRGKLVSGPEGSANTVFRLGIDYDGAGPGGVQWIVYETYYNFDGANSTNSTSTWQDWNVRNGKFWGAWNAAGDYATNKTLNEIIAANPDAIVKEISVGMGAQGFVLNPSWQSLVDKVTFNGATYDFAPASIATCATATPVRFTNLSGWDLSSSSTDGSALNQVSSSGLHVKTEAAGHRKAAGYYPVDFALGNLGTTNIADTLAVTTHSGTVPPSTQLVVDFDNNGTDDGILVGEPTYYGNNWWLSNSAQQFVKDGAPQTGGGNGSNWFGTAEEWLNAFPAAHVKKIGYSLGSGVTGDFTITKLTVGCTEYTFGPIAPAVTIADPATSSIVSTKAHGNKLPVTGTFTDDIKANYLTLQLVYKGNSKAIGTVYGYGSVFNPAATYADANGDFSYNLTVPANIEDGQYSLWYVGTDFTGGVSTRTERKFVIDNTAPTKPTITTPVERQWFKAAPITNAWTASTDANGIAKYQVAYAYADGHSFANSTCPGAQISGVNVYCRDTSGTSRSHQPALSEQGKVTIWVRAFDNAGNTSDWSKSVTYNYDATSPTTNIVVSSVADGKFTVSGHASDNIDLNRVYVQLVNRETSQRYGGTTVNLIGQGKDADWSVEYNIADLPEGNYAAHVSATDMAGNSGTAGWTANFFVDNTAPNGAVTAVGTVSAIATLGSLTEEIKTPAGWTKNGNEYIREHSANGTYTVEIEDLAGNKRTIAYTVTSIFVSVPQQTIPNTGSNESDGNDPQVLPLQQPGFTASQAIANADVLGASDNEGAPRVKGASDQSKTLASTANPDVLGASDNKFFGLVWYWWLLIAAAALAAGWWIIAAARRRRDGDDA